MNFFVIQLIGLLGASCNIITYQKNNSKDILFYQVVMALTFVVYYFLLGAYTGAALNLLTSVRNYIFYSKSRGDKWAKHSLWFYGFLILSFIASTLTWKNGFSALPMIGMFLSTIALWLGNAKYTRYLILVSIPFWSVYNFVGASYAGLVSDLFTISSILVAIVRYDVKKKQS